MSITSSYAPSCTANAALEVTRAGEIAPCALERDRKISLALMRGYDVETRCARPGAKLFPPESFVAHFFRGEMARP